MGEERHWRKSAREYARAIGVWGYAVIAFLSTIAWIAEVKDWPVPGWVWMALALLIAPFLAFHKLRLAHLDALEAKDARFAQLKAKAKALLGKRDEQIRDLSARLSALEAQGDATKLALAELESTVLDGETPTAALLFRKFYLHCRMPVFLQKSLALHLYGNTNRWCIIRAGNALHAFGLARLVRHQESPGREVADSEYDGLMLDERHWFAYVEPLAGNVVRAVEARLVPETLKALGRRRIKLPGQEHHFVTALDMLKEMGPWLRRGNYSAHDVGEAIKHFSFGKGPVIGTFMADSFLDALQDCELLQVTMTPDTAIVVGDMVGIQEGIPQAHWRLNDLGLKVYTAATEKPLPGAVGMAVSAP